MEGAPILGGHNRQAQNSVLQTVPSSSSPTEGVADEIAAATQQTRAHPKESASSIVSLSKLPPFSTNVPRMTQGASLSLLPSESQRLSPVFRYPEPGGTDTQTCCLNICCQSNNGLHTAHTLGFQTAFTRLKVDAFSIFQHWQRHLVI